MTKTRGVGRRPFRYRDAVELLAGSDARWIQLVDWVLTGGIAVGTAAVGPAPLSLVDPKNELITKARQALQEVPRLTRQAPSPTRSGLLGAAHTVLVITSYFEAIGRIAGDSVPSSALTLSSGEQTLLASNAQLGYAAPFEALSREIPVPSPYSSYSETRDRLRNLYRDLTENFCSFINGLQAYDAIDSGVRSDFESQLRSDAADVALALYDENYRRLAADIPEYKLWDDRLAHENIQVTLLNLSSEWHRGLHELQESQHRITTGLVALEHLLSSLTSPHQPGDRESNLADELVRHYESEVQRPFVDVRRLVADSLLRIPPPVTSYVDPSFRVREWDGRSDISQERWWQSLPARESITIFLAGYLTSPSSAAAPLLLLGHPGAGKSMLTRMLAGRLPAEDYLPIRVELRHVSAEASIQAQIEQALRLASGREIGWSEVRRSGRSPVVLLDGLDELLQATDVNRADYLELVQQFQEREADQGVPVRCVVTSRTVVADRARVPAGTVVAKLDDFDESRVRAWIANWNHHNRSYFEATGTAPFAPAGVARLRDFASQPLLLLMLAIFDADGNALGPPDATSSNGWLYEALLQHFVRREVMKAHPEQAEQELDNLVDEELRRLGVVAIGMFNRGRQWITERECVADLSALGLADANDTRATSVLGRFFFMHETQAQESVRQQTRHTYEFLHATFAEYLVARLVHALVLDLADSEHQRRQARGLPAASQAEHHPVATLLSYEPLSQRAQVLEFLGDFLLADGLDRLGRVQAGLERLLRILDQDGAPSPQAYRPKPLSSTSRAAVTSCNALLLLALVGEQAGEHAPGDRTIGALDLRRLELADVPSAWWRRTTTLWQAQLSDAAWQSLSASLEAVPVFGEDGVASTVLVKVLRQGDSRNGMPTLLESGFLNVFYNVSYTLVSTEWPSVNDLLSVDSRALAAAQAARTLARRTGAGQVTVAVKYSGGVAVASLAEVLTALQQEWPADQGEVAYNSLVRLACDVAVELHERGPAALQVHARRSLLLVMRSPGLGRRPALMPVVLAAARRVAPVEPEPDYFESMIQLASRLPRSKIRTDSLHSVVQDLLGRLDVPHLLDTEPIRAFRICLLLEDNGLPIASLAPEFGELADVLRRLDARHLASDDPSLALQAIRVARRERVVEWAAFDAPVVADYYLPFMLRNLDVADLTFMLAAQGDQLASRIGDWATAARQESAWLVSVVEHTGNLYQQWVASRSGEVDTRAQLERVMIRHYGWLHDTQVSRQSAAGAIVEALGEALHFPPP